MQQEDDDTGLILQPGRILRIVKADPDVLVLNKEGAAVLAKATELFLSEIARMAVETTKAKALKELEYSEVALAVKEWSACDFLQDIVPQQVLGSAVLERIAKEQQQATVDNMQ